MMRWGRWSDKIREMDRNEVFDKLEGLRGALIRMFLIIAVLSGVSFFFWKDALHFLQKPLGLPLIMYSLPEGFFTSLRLSLFMGVFLAVPFSLVGAFWLLYLLDYNTSIAVWVGIIALAGLDAETGVVMLLYLDLAHGHWQKKGRMSTRGDLVQAIHHGAVKRIRPKIMTISVIIAGLLPIMWSHGTGADVMKRIAAPMVGGVVTSGIMELLVYPVIFFIWRGLHLQKELTATSQGDIEED